MKKRSILCFAISVAIGILRVVTVRSSVDPENGFYIKGEILPTVFTVLLAAAFILFAAVAFTFKKTEFDKDLRGGVFGAAATAVLALSMVWCGVSNLLSGLSLRGILALIGAAALIIAAPSHIVKSSSQTMALCLLIPCVWCGFDLMATFRSYSTIVTISDYLLNSLSLTALLLFMFYSAKAYICNETSAMLHFSAYAAFLGVFVTALPAAIAACGSADVFSVSFMPNIIVLSSMLIYAPMTVYTVEKHEIRYTSL